MINALHEIDIEKIMRAVPGCGCYLEPDVRAERD
jgi:hypothetical protein